MKVRIERLEPARVATFSGFGECPEPQAYTKLVAWAEPRGMLPDHEGRRIFGFNDPNPSPGRPDYGYAVWITVDPETECGGEPEIKDFAGGLYAVTRVEGIRNITSTWHRLSTWRESSRYECAHHQWLEEHVGPLVPTQGDDKIVLDLFLPIAE